MPVDATIQFLGAAGSVTGSRYLLTIDGMRILVDAGLFQEPDFEPINVEPFEVDPATIDAIVVTHAHIDHSGYVPRLVHDGFRGPIWCTPATAALLEIVWEDVARIAEHDSEIAERRHHRSHRRRPEEPPPIYRSTDVAQALRQVQTAEYGGTTRLARGITLMFRDAGHILGAAGALIEWSEGHERTRILFSGDLGRPGRPILHDPTRPPEAEYVVVESTYGDRTHPAGDIEARLADVITRTVMGGGNVIIPAFAVQRSQEVLYHLRHLLDQRLIPHVPVYFDSPMAIAVTRVFRDFPELLDRDVAEGFRTGDSLFEFSTLRITDTSEESRAINSVEAPHIVIAGAGMCDGGRIRHHLLHNASRPECTILFTGFQAPGTLGRRIVEGADEIVLFGEHVPVRARIEQMEEFSAHADRDEVVAWLRAMPGAPRRAFVTHGTPIAAEAFRRHLHDSLGWEAYTPERGETVAL